MRQRKFYTYQQSIDLFWKIGTNRKIVLKNNIFRGNAWLEIRDEHQQSIFFKHICYWIEIRCLKAFHFLGTPSYHMSDYIEFSRKCMAKNKR